MKRIILLLLCAFFLFNIIAQEAITNRDVIMMKTSKMSDDLIISKITSSDCSFDLSTSGILELKNAKITDRVVEQMISVSPQEELMTNDDVIRMFQAKINVRVILAKIDYSDSDFDVSSEGLVKLNTARIPKHVIKRILETSDDRRGNKNTNNGAGKSNAMNPGKVLRYEDVQNTRTLKYFDTYVAKDGSVFERGDKVTLRFPVNNDRHFHYVYLTKLSDLRKHYLDDSYSNKEFKFIGVSVIKESLFSQKNFKHAQFLIEGEGFINNVLIDIENAINSGEVQSKVTSEHEALEAIKRAKDKFDLGLISEEEYKKVVEEMKQYIK